MANKKTREERIRAEREKKFADKVGKLKVFPIIGAASALVTAVLFFLNWGYIYNTDIAGNEVSFTGYNIISAAISGKFTEAADAFGDIAVPFFYYAPEYVKALAVLSSLALAASILAVTANVISLAYKKPAIDLAAAILHVVCAALLAACFAVALSMKNSNILPVYCSGNPACSIGSLAIIPAITALCGAVAAFMKMFAYRRIAAEFGE